MGKTIHPPKSLQAAGRDLFRTLQREYAITDAGGLTLLRLVAEYRDTAVAALAAIQKDGMYNTDKYGQRRPHPAAAILRDARAGELAALRALHLDIEPLKAIGRPGG